MTELREKLNNIIEEKNTKIIPENLRAGVEAFGVQGNFTSDADATAADIAKDKIAYVNGEKVIGNLSNDFNAKVSANGLTTFTVSPIVEEIDFTNIDTSNCTLITFDGCVNLTKIKGQINTSKVTNFTSMFRNCSKLDHFPITNQPQTNSRHYAQYMYYNCTKLTGEATCNYTYITGSQSQFNYMFGLTSIDTIKLNATYTNYPPQVNLTSLCFGCSNLVNVIFTNKYVLSMNCQNMFVNCPNLSDESLNNILLAASNTTNNTTKTLAYLGLTSDQATKCQSLSNYETFVAAGWTTGY